MLSNGFGITTLLIILTKILLAVSIIGVFGGLIMSLFKYLGTIDYKNCCGDIFNFKSVEKVVCEKCGNKNIAGSKFCSNCSNKLKIECASCHKELEKEWKCCPNCGTEKTEVNLDK